MVFSNCVMQALQSATVGQEYAVAALTRAVTLAGAGLRRHGDLLGVLLFIGPSGSGKTHMSRTLARILTGSENAAVHINCEQIGQAADPYASLEQQLGVGSQPQNGNFAASEFRLIVFDEIYKASDAFRTDLARWIDCGLIWTSGRSFSLSGSFVILMSDLPRKKADQLAGRTIGFFLDGEPPLDISRRQAV